MYHILSIDIGINNLALVLSQINDDWTISKIVDAKLINITDMKHERVDIIDCNLHHEKTHTDWIEHVFQEEYELFSKANYILIERQPPQGFVCIEQLIFSKFRNKAKLIHPSSFSSFITWRKNLDYDERKIESIKFAETLLKRLNTPEILDTFTRKHDVADAICMMSYWIYGQREEWKTQQRKERYETVKMSSTLNQWFEQYKYMS